MLHLGDGAAVLRGFPVSRVVRLPPPDRGCRCRRRGSPPAPRRPASPSAAPWRRARTVSSRMPVRAARSRISATQPGVAGWPWRRPSSHRASRMWTSSQTYGIRQPRGPRARVEQRGERLVDVTGGLGDQRQPAGRDALPAGVADLAGPGERLLEAVGGAGQVALGQQHLAEHRLRPGQERRASGRAGPGPRRRRAARRPRRASPRRRLTRPSIDRPKASRRGSSAARDRRVDSSRRDVARG